MGPPWKLRRCKRCSGLQSAASIVLRVARAPVPCTVGAGCANGDGVGRMRSVIFNGPHSRHTRSGLGRWFPDRDPHFQCRMLSCVGWWWWWWGDGHRQCTSFSQYLHILMICARVFLNEAIVKLGSLSLSTRSLKNSLKMAPPLRSSLSTFERLPEAPSAALLHTQSTHTTAAHTTSMEATEAPHTA